MRILLLFALLLLPATAQAHASLESATPAAGSTVAAAPSEIVLTFSQDIEAAFSRIDVRDPKGARIGGKTVPGGNRRELRVPIKATGNGRYTVNWNVLSVDTHKTAGKFIFQIGP